MAEYQATELLPPVAAFAHDGLRFWQYMLAGSVAGIVEHTAMFPVDTIKTLMQAGTPPCRPQLGFRAAIRHAVADGGAAALYRGLAAIALGAGPAHAIYFSAYEFAKRALADFSPGGDGPLVHAASGVVATVASDAVLTPMDTVKQRLQLRSSPYGGVADCIRTMLRDEGTSALFASYRTTVVMNAPFTAVHFATYEAAKRTLGAVDEEGLAMHATAGAAAGAIAAFITTPLDVVKTQLQCQGVRGCTRFSNSSTVEVLRAIVVRDGYSGVMRGWKPRMVFHTPAAAIVWSTYEASKSFFQRLNEEWTG